MSKTKRTPPPGLNTLAERVAARQAELGLDADGKPTTATADAPTEGAEAGPEENTTVAVADAENLDEAAAPTVVDADLDDDEDDDLDDETPPAPAAERKPAPADEWPATWFIPERHGMLKRPWQARQLGRFQVFELELRRVSEPTTAASRNLAAAELRDAVLADARKLPEVEHVAFLVSERHRTVGGVALAAARTRDLDARREVLRLSREPELGRLLVEIDREMREHADTQKRLQEEAEAVLPLLDAARKKAADALARVAEHHAIMSRSWLAGQRDKALAAIAAAAGDAVTRLISTDQQLAFWYDAPAVEKVARALVERAAEQEPEPSAPTPVAPADVQAETPADDAPQTTAEVPTEAPAPAAEGAPAANENDPAPAVLTGAA